MSDLMDNIKNLREMTGAGFLDCKLALKENDHNLEKSIASSLVELAVSELKSQVTQVDHR